MKGTVAGFLIALAAILFAQSVNAVEYGETPQQFMAGGVKTGKGPAQRTQRYEAPTLDTGILIGFGGSWLEANLGASAPRGAPGPWCGYAMRMEMVAMGRGDPGPAYNAVSSWRTYGSLAPRGAVGSLFVSAGHISKVVAHDCGEGSVRTISGNATGRRVAYMCEPLSRLVVSRWP